MKRSMVTILIVAVMLFLAACGNGGSIFKDGIRDYISTTYPLYDTISSASNTDQYASVYQAQGRDIASVSEELQNHETPEDLSEIRDGKQILVYDDLFVTLTESEENASDTMIEVAEEEFARDNYRPSFFEGYLLASLLNTRFGSGWSTSRSQDCNLYPERCYGGYNSSGTYVGKNAIPTIRGSSNRGGGIGSGK
ncbi:DUF4247 domain-containing protein [Jeotgalibacillus sp. R-1-5s-1]|uniref:DUF4247 domain-containing protein n=1 Tax=Jeotgalibacillus sp. R-1-5s-1 TaxID=2555897 RepID=UPI001FC88019|nr:DUF4247 domain-containing protein [Jeotgalibacillus sp. R-1-5s-1]